MRILLFLVLISAAWAQTQDSDPHAVVNGKPVSLSEIEGLVGAMPPQLRGNPEQLFRYYGFIERLAAKAEAAKLFEQSPYKDQLELQRKQVMAQAQMDQFYKDVAISDGEVKEYYEKHKDDFAVAEVESNGVKAVFRKSDVNADPAIRKAIFALKPGELSAPVATAKGTATYRLKSISIPAFEAARPDVWRTLADARFAAWMDEVRKTVTVTR
jgi:hypothetical protein